MIMRGAEDDDDEGDDDSGRFAPNTELGVVV